MAPGLIKVGRVTATLATKTRLCARANEQQSFLWAYQWYNALVRSKRFPHYWGSMVVKECLMLHRLWMSVVKQEHTPSIARERERERRGTCGGNANLGEIKRWSEHLRATVRSTARPQPQYSLYSCKISEASCNERVGKFDNCSLHYPLFWWLFGSRSGGRRDKTLHGTANTMVQGQIKWDNWR